MFFPVIRSVPRMILLGTALVLGGVLISPVAANVAGATLDAAAGQLLDDLPPVIDDSEVAIVLLDIGDDPDVVVKLIEQSYGRGWPAARQVAENAPIIMLEGLTLDAAEELMWSYPASVDGQR